MSADTWDQEIILYHATGDIAMQVGPGNPELGDSSTTGLMDPTYVFGLTVQCNEAGSVPDGACWFILNPNAIPNERVTFGALKAMYR
jgi:hypothetical protein